MLSSEFWVEIRSVRSPAPAATYTPIVPDEDFIDTETGEHGPPDWPVQSITGRSLILTYLDARGQSSERQVMCRKLSRNGEHRYLHAFCFVRHALRQFRVDRIRLIIDPETGELFDPATTLLDQFMPDSVAASPHRYGLSPRVYADLNAALNVLAFIARCDGQWHPLEEDRIADFATAFWMRSEINAPLHVDEIMKHAARLAPDAETFWVSLTRCAEHPVLSQIIRRHASSVIAADGVMHEKEFYWGSRLDAFMQEY